MHYLWIIQRLRKLFEDAGVMPTAIMTDRELALITAIKYVFKDLPVQHLLCWVHIKHNIEVNATRILKNKESVKRLCSQVWRLFLSRTEEQYEERLLGLRTSWRSGVVGYIEKVWLIPYKTNIVCAWTEHNLHFFTRTSNR